jgi:hypothetical protein
MKALGRTSLVFVVALVGSVVGVMPAVAEPLPPEVTTVISHEAETQHLEADPACLMPVGVTEIQEGTERFHTVEQGDTLHFVAGETVRIQEISDDPSIPTSERQATDAVIFQHIENGGAVVEVFHESFHDKPTVWGDIAFYVTFVSVDGEVRVDRVFGRNLPPEGC